MAKLLMTTRYMLHGYWRKSWSAADMSEWAEQLLIEGYDTPEICMLAARPDYAWDQAQSLFRRICAQIGLSEDIDRDIQKVVERESIKAYERGEISGAALMWSIAELQKRLDLPQVIAEVDCRKQGQGRYYTLDGWEGEALESLIREALRRHGLVGGLSGR